MARKNTWRLVTALLIVAGALAGGPVVESQAPAQAALDPPKAALVWSIPWDSDWVTAVAFAGSHRRLAAGNKLGQIFVWDLPEKPAKPGEGLPPARRLDGHTNSVTALAATPDGRWLISASLDRTVRIWDLQAAAAGTDEVILDARSRAKAAKAAAAKGQKSEETQAVRVTLHKAERVLETHKDWVRSLSLSKDGTRLLTGDDQGVAILWELPSAKEIRRLKVPGWVTGAALSPDAKLAATCEYASRYAQFRNAVQLWDMDTGQARFDLTKECRNAIAGGFSPDGKLLALGQGGETDTGKVYVIDTATGKKVRDLSGHLGGVTGCVFHPGGRYLATCGRDTVVRLWNLDDGKAVKLGQERGGQFKDWIHAVAFSPDGKRLAAADMGGFVQVWSLE